MTKETWQQKCKRLNNNMYDCWKYDSSQSMGFDYYEYEIKKGG